MSSPDTGPARTIGFDGSRLTGRDLTGTETYSLELLRHIAQYTDPEELVVYLNATEVAESLPAGPIYRPIPQRRLWTHVRLAREMESRPPGVLFVPAHVIPLRHPKSVVTIHDVAFRIAPDLFGRRERSELDSATRLNCRAATHIIAVSQRTKADLIEQYGIEADRISVVHHGVSKRFRPPTPDDTREVRERYGLAGRQYMLTVGTQHERKNLGGLLRVFEAIRDLGHDLDLVIAGGQGPATEKLMTQISQSRHALHVQISGYVPFEDLPALYGAAELFMLFSWYEGFGMPALEAMACGTPVIASNTGSLPEICGSAARLASPDYDEEAIDAICEMLDSETRRQRMIDAGTLWARRFSWERSARSTLKVLRAVRDNQNLNDDAMGWSEAAMTFLARDLEQTT